jgi:hypothetical protein
MINSSGVRLTRTKEIPANQPLCVNGLTSRDLELLEGLTATHRHEVSCVGHTIVAPKTSQQIISANLLRRNGVTVLLCGITDKTYIQIRGHQLHVPTFPDGLDYLTHSQLMYLIGLMTSESSNWRAFPAVRQGSMHWAALGDNAPYYVSSSQQPRIQLFKELHYMYCHPSDHAFKAALSNGSMLGVALVPADVYLARSVLGPCPQCLAGKSVNPSYVSSPTMPAGRCGTRVFMNLVPLAGTTIGGNNHVLLWLDAYSGYLGVCGIDNKNPSLY